MYIFYHSRLHKFLWCTEGITTSYIYMYIYIYIYVIQFRMSNTEEMSKWAYKFSPQFLILPFGYLLKKLFWLLNLDVQPVMVLLASRLQQFFYNSTEILINGIFFGKLYTLLIVYYCILKPLKYYYVYVTVYY